MSRIKFTYTNWSTEIFQGFYESLLYNSDSILNMVEGEPNPPEGFYYDIHDFEGFENKVGAEARRLIWNAIPDEDCIVYDMRFLGISSPRFYNYSTDRLELEVDVDIDNLKRWCLYTHREKFNEYLKENFSSYDGFHSFVKNNVEEFESQMEDESEKERCYNVMFEFYLLGLDELQSGSDFSSYEYDLISYANYALWDRLCLYCESDRKYYQYTLSDDEKSVIVGDEIKD